MSDYPEVQLTVRGRQALVYRLPGGRGIMLKPGDNAVSAADHMALRGPSTRPSFNDAVARRDIRETTPRQAPAPVPEETTDPSEAEGAGEPDTPPTIAEQMDAPWGEVRRLITATTDAEVLAEMLEAEEAGRDRSSAVALLEAKLAALDSDDDTEED